MLTRRTLIAAAAAAALPAAGASGALAAPNHVLAMAMEIDDAISFDPAESYEFSDNECVGNIYERLMTPDLADPTKLIPMLAKSWDVAADGSSITFHLRDDAKFESGNPVTAEDAVFSLHRVVTLNKSPGFIITEFGFTPANIAQTIIATDQHTLVLKLPIRQAPSFVLNCLTAAVGSIVDKKTAMAHETGGDLGNAWLKSHTAGSGAYKLTDWAASNHIILDANPHARVPAKIARVFIRHVPEAAAQFLLLQRGGVDIARNLNSDQLKSLKTDANFRQTATPLLSSLYIAMNQDVPELAKPEVHQAIKWALGYDAIATNITPGTWEVGQSFLPRGIPGALDEQPFHKDVAKAKQLLAQAGYPNGFSISMDAISATPYAEIAQAVQADLAAVGITVQLLPGEQKQVITKTRQRKHQLALLVWGSDYLDANSNAQGFCADPDDGPDSKVKIIAWRSHFHDKQLTDQVAAAAVETDAAKRIAIYQAMQRTFWEVAPFAIMLQQISVATMGKDVQGLILGPSNVYTSYTNVTKA